MSPPSRTASLSSFRHALKQGQKIGGFDNLNVLVVAQGQQMPVTADEVLRLPNDGTFQNGIVVGVGGHDFQSAG